MGKKMPIYLKTLTILASTLSLTPVGAVSETGPWSFDELTAAKDEVDAEASVRCTDSLTRAACINSIMEEKGGIYYAGLWKFRYNQFTPLSMNFATGELGYYYNSTNEYRKNNNKRPYLKDYLTKLFIVQVEQGYDNWAVDLRAGVKDSEHWQVLYDGSTTEEGDSLLPYDQKFSLFIGKPSFDSKYEKYLRVLYMDTFNTEAEINTYDFTECAEGRTCEAWYDATNPFLYFKDFRYTEGYNDGYDSGFSYGKIIGQSDGYYGGYDTGYGDGYDNGYTDGFINGQNDSYNSGYQAGLSDGHDTGYAEGHTNGKNEGYNAGYNEGLNNGMNEGYNNGYTAGHENGTSEGYQNGYAAGLEAGRTEGYQAGQTEGYQAGMNDGYNAGYTNGYEEGYNTDRSDSSIDNLTDENSNNESGDNTNNGNDSVILPASNDVAELNDDNKQNTDNSLLSTINTASAISGATAPGSSAEGNKTTISVSSTPSIKSFAPNTGAPTAEEKSTEFPWWLGVITLTSLGVFVWFFGPKHKSHKKTTKKTKKV